MLIVFFFAHGSGQAAGSGAMIKRMGGVADVLDGEDEDVSALLACKDLRKRITSSGSELRLPNASQFYKESCVPKSLKLMVTVSHAKLTNPCSGLLGRLDCRPANCDRVFCIGGLQRLAEQP